MDNDSYELLSRKRRGKKYISNIPNYDILSNQAYTDAMFYTTMDQRIVYEGKVEHRSSDIIAEHLLMGEQRYDHTK